MPSNRRFTNNASTTLVSAITSGQTSFDVTDGSIFPTLSGSEYFHVTIDNQSGTIEILKVTAISSNTLTVTRAQDGTSASAFAAGTIIELRMIADDIDKKAPLDEDILPETTSVYDLGSPTYKFADLNLSGNVVVDGTVDGRDVAADGTKLDGIEAAADVTDEANVTAALSGATLTDVGTPASGDLILLQDASDSNNLKVAQFSTFGGAGSGDAWSDVVDADIIPDADGTRDLGSVTYRFAEGHFDKLVVEDLVGGVYDTSGNEVLLFDTTGAATNYLQISNSSSDISITAKGDSTNVGIDLVTKGNGQVSIGASGAFVFDPIAMSIFDVVNTGDQINFTGTGLELVTGGVARIDLTDLGMRLNDANARVNAILDEDTMSSNSATALATQQSIKAYVDSVAAGDSWGDPVDASIVPATDSLYNLGSGTNYFATAYIDSITTTGNIVVGGTVDGRDVAADGTKLDGIEAAADVTDEANVTAALSGATLTSIVATTTDKLLLQDVSDSDNLKQDTIGDILGLYDSATATLTNKTINADNNTITNIVIGAECTGASTALTDTANLMYLDTAQEHTATKNFNMTTITSTTNSVAWNLAANQVAKHTLTENTTLAAPTNQVAGATYILIVVQDTTPRTLAFNAVYKFPGGTAPTVSTGSGAVDILTFISDGTNMYGSYMQNMS